MTRVIVQRSRLLRLQPSHQEQNPHCRQSHDAHRALTGGGPVERSGLWKELRMIGRVGARAGEDRRAS